MTSLNGNISRVTGPLCGELTGRRWPGALIFFIYAWINGWVNNREADDLRRHRAHYDVTVMEWWWLEHFTRPFGYSYSLYVYVECQKHKSQCSNWLIYPPLLPHPPTPQPPDPTPTPTPNIQNHFILKTWWSFVTTNSFPHHMNPVWQYWWRQHFMDAWSSDAVSVVITAIWAVTQTSQISWTIDVQGKNLVRSE